MKPQPANKALSKRKSDLIILDLGLPDMDSVEVIKTIRAWSTVPMIT
jgi:two-component system, OmpR family, KDP operon response regulator KdpE